jgi:hypothetical protein
MSLQQVYVGAHTAIQQTSYSFTNLAWYLNGVMTWVGDSVLYERLMNERYDNLIPRLEKAIDDAE